MSEYLLPNGRVLRYSFRERLMHWMAGISYVYLLLTGLAFWSPWLYWIAYILGGPTISRELHPWVGLILWEPHWIPWNLRALRLIAVIVHPIAALVTIALFMIHVYMGTAVEPGAFASIIRGDVSRRWAARYHRAWYEQITREVGPEDPARR